MSSRHSVSVEIGASLSAGWTSAFRRAPAQVSQLGNAIRGLEARSRRLEQFQTLKEKTDRAKTAWRTAQQTVARLNREMARTEAPTQAQIRALQQAERAANLARTTWERSSQSLENHRRQMEAVGESTRGLTGQQQRLGTALASLRSRYQALGETQRRVQANTARRDALRGQILDTVALGAALGAPIKAAIDFESAMADVGKVVSFDQPDGLIRMGDTLKALSREIPITATGLAEITAAGGQLGISANDLPAFTTTVAKMATAFDMLPDQAGDAMAKLANVYLMPITEMASLGDAINHLSDNTAAKARDIVPVLQRVGGTAKQFGLSAVEVAALADSFIALGKPPEVAGTAINALLVKLQTASKQGKKFQTALSDIGWSGQELEDAIAGDAQGALMGFLETLEGVDEKSRAGILNDLFGMEYSDDISLLAGSLDNYRKALSLTADKTQYAGSMQREFETRSQTTANNLVLLKNGLIEVGINLGSVLLPPLNAVVGMLRTGSAAMADFTREHPILTKGITVVVGGLIAAKVAAMGLGYGFTFIRGAFLSTVATWQSVTAGLALMRARMLVLGTSAIPTVITGIRALAVAVMSNPIGLVVGGLALAAGLIISNWERVKAFFTTIWEPIRPYWETFAAWVGKIWEKISSPIETIKSMWGSVSGLFGSDATEKQPVQIGKAVRTTAVAAGMAISPVAVAQTTPASIQPSVQPVAVAGSPNQASTPMAGQTTINATINVYGASGQDEDVIVQRVMTELANLKAQAQRGALHD